MEFNNETLLNNIIERLKPLNPLKIILFGSFAYGTPNEDSDLDICVVKKVIKSKYQEQKEIRFLLEDLSIAKDILVVSEDEFDFYKNEFGSIFMDIDRKSRVLWSCI